MLYETARRSRRERRCRDECYLPFRLDQFVRLISNPAVANAAAVTYIQK
jgi:hypothetical protein